MCPNFPWMVFRAPRVCKGTGARVATSVRRQETRKEIKVARVRYSGWVCGESRMKEKLKTRRSPPSFRRGEDCRDRLLVDFHSVASTCCEKEPLPSPTTHLLNYLGVSSVERFPDCSRQNTRRSLPDHLAIVRQLASGLVGLWNSCRISCDPIFQIRSNSPEEYVGDTLAKRNSGICTYLHSFHAGVD